MNNGLCHLSNIALREAPSHKSQMVSQLLFGETYNILEKRKEWVYVENHYDNYRGYIPEKQLKELDEISFKAYQSAAKHLAGATVHLAMFNYKQLAILMGSALPSFTKNHFTLFGSSYHFREAVYEIGHGEDKAEVVKNLALQFLGAPYLWGGRSILGIDCSGFSQLIYKMIGIPLLRDAYQQAEQGELVYFIHEGKVGDLAFFDNEEGAITHVGILLNNKQIVHASGTVRMDSIDQQGIFNNETKRYTHKLRLVKRFFD